MGTSKQLENWKASPNTKRYIKALKNNSLKSSEFIKSEEGRNGGTWIQEKLILSLARYISIEFEIWCDEQIATLIREGTVSIDDKKANLLLKIYKGGQSAVIACKQMTDLELKPVVLELEEKKEVINSLTEEIDPVAIRYIVKKYLDRNTKDHQDAWNTVYGIVGRELKKDIKFHHRTYTEKLREMVDKNKITNKKLGLKGEERLKPYAYSQTDCNISKLEYICKILKEGKLLMRVLAKVFDVGLESLVSDYKDKILIGG